MTPPVPGAARTYEVRTYGCQMNVHDSERLTGLLEDAGYVAAPDGDDADVVVFNTCAVRENADNKLYGNLGHLAPVKAKRPGMQIAVGGCLAQKDKATITKRAPYVDVVFGTHNIGSLPVLLERARIADESQVEILESLEVFPSTLPTKRDSVFAAWVSISVGCDNTCTFCIVPSLRGTEKDRRPGDILAEVQALVAQGVLEVTLLGHGAAGEAPVFPPRALPRHPVPGPGGDAGRGDHHRHHRRLPRRERGRLRRHAVAGRRGPLRGRVPLPVLPPPRDAGRHHGRPGAAGGRAG